MPVSLQAILSPTQRYKSIKSTKKKWPGTLLKLFSGHISVLDVSLNTIIKVVQKYPFKKWPSQSIVKTYRISLLKIEQKQWFFTYFPLKQFLVDHNYCLNSSGPDFSLHSLIYSTNIYWVPSIFHFSRYMQYSQWLEHSFLLSLSIPIWIRVQWGSHMLTINIIDKSCGIWDDHKWCVKKGCLKMQGLAVNRSFK